MYGSRLREGSSDDAAACRETAEGGSTAGALVRRLWNEFGAPVGLLDPRTGAWLARVGAPPEAFPVPDPGLLAASASAVGSAVWPGDGPGGPVWLVLPVEVEGRPGPLVALAGFAPGPDPVAPPAAWGPRCPAPALRAWGRLVAEQLRVRSDPRRAGQDPASTPPPPGPDTGERQIVARLIRRLRISDYPGRFQQLAANALRAALGVQAVAWVPCHYAEPVVVSGDVGRLRGNGYRLLLPAPAARERGAVILVNDPLTLPEPEVRRVIAAPADSQGAVGWLIAVNPLDGRPFTPADGELAQPIASLIATQQINARVYADLKDLLFGVIRALTAAIDAKDPYTSGHSERVARIAVRLAAELGMTANQRGDLYLMGLLHDIGKIGVDDAVLKKPGPLTPEEYRQIQSHVEIGVHILTDLKKLSHLLPGVRHHHESLDGTGYPSGLAGEAIPFEARILAVADSYDAMSSTRPYRRRLTPSQIDEILRSGSGVQWDPKIVDALFACRMDLEMIRQKGLGESLQLVVSETLGRT
jgi:HD-GYP domain-containing protein (c-di-GMP phosphodiesterase class II)